MGYKEIISDDYIKLENTYINLPKKMFSYQFPDQVPNPNLVIFNKELAQELGLNEEFLQSDDGIKILSGNGILEETTPISQAYAGHQFGHFTMLGDGRAVLLGELISNNKERFDIQLKGSGTTQYSRGGDGKASLGPMLREYIISEGMKALGIPTSRSLAVISTGEDIIREKILPGAILTRIAKSHIRIGTFQYAAAYGNIDDVRSLADYTLNRHFKNYSSTENKYLYLLNEVIAAQAKLISKWQLVGFIHGVMNTDNMSICGESIDYGPCAFMDIYDPNTVFSSIDINGRYSYENQPKIGAWNLARFAETLLPLLNDNIDEAIKIAEKSLSNYKGLYDEYWNNGMRSKLGIFNKECDDNNLFTSLLNIMKKFKADYTNTFYDLTLNNLTNNDIYNSNDFNQWYTNWQNRLSKQKNSKEESINLMKKNNPTVIPRNYRVEQALSAAVNDNNYDILQELLNVLKSPYDYSNINIEYSKIPKSTKYPYKTFCGT